MGDMICVKIWSQIILIWVPEYVKSFDTIADILERSVAHPFIQEVNPTFGSLSQWILSGNIAKVLLKEVKHSYPGDVLHFWI